MEGLCLQRSASDSAQDRLGQPAGHSSSTDGNVNVINIISNLNIEEKRYQKISGFFFCCCSLVPALARVVGVLRNRESHT